MKYKIIDKSVIKVEDRWVLRIIIVDKTDTYSREINFETREAAENALKSIDGISEWTEDRYE